MTQLGTVVPLSLGERGSGSGGLTSRELTDDLRHYLSRAGHAFP